MRPLSAGLGLLLSMASLGAASKPNVPGHDPSRIQVLLLTGYNSTPMHQWRFIDPVLRSILECTGKFQVHIDEEPRGASAYTFKGYDVLLLDYSDYTPALGPKWPEITRQAYLDFLRNGGGVVAFHVTVGSFPEWPEFKKTLGIFDYRHIGHAPYHMFTVKVRDSGNPITQCEPQQFREWGEIYNGIHLLPDARILATAFDDSENCLRNDEACGSGKDQPILWTARYGKGRMFVTTLGHDLVSVSMPSFKTTLTRGTMWAATGHTGACERVDQIH